VLTGGGGGSSRSTTWLLNTTASEAFVPLGYNQESKQAARSAHVSASLHDPHGSYMFFGGGIADPSDWTTCTHLDLYQLDVSLDPRWAPLLMLEPLSFLILCVSKRSIQNFTTLPYAARDATLTAFYDVTTNTSWVLYFGGLCGVQGHSTLFRLDIHNKSAGWKAIATLNVAYARSEHVAAILETEDNRTEFVVIGGYNPSVSVSCCGWRSVLSTVLRS
jgi:hypothetical protein